MKDLKTTNKISVAPMLLQPAVTPSNKIYTHVRCLSPIQVEERYGYKIVTQANDRYLKRGPRYFKCGRRVLYLVEDIEAWLLRNPVETIDSINSK